MYSKLSSDASLIDGCKKQNQLAQKNLYMKFYSAMLNTCMRYVNNKQDAIDILNRGFLKVFNSITDYKGEGVLEGWVRKIIINTAIDYTRSERKYYSIMNFDAIHEEPIDSDLIDSINGDEILNIIQQLPLACRQVFSLFFIDDYSHKEIANMLNITEAASKWHLQNAKKQMKELIKKQMRPLSYAN